MTTVEEILEAVKELPPEKKDELKHRLMSLWLLWENLTLGWATTDPGHRYHGLSSASHTRIRQRRERRPPIQIKGKPISETVIEDRR